jgi:hypothetical protein
VGLKKLLLPQPTAREYVPSHLRVPHDTPIGDVAFLIAHRLMRDGRDEGEVLDAAAGFAAWNLEAWREGDFISVPQPQVMEAYNLVPESPR